MTFTKDEHPLPLSDILRDLALLRASDIDLAAVLPHDAEGSAPKRAAAVDAARPSRSESDADADADTSVVVQRSYEFAKEARAALRVQNRGDLDGAGDTVERVREGLEEILKGLEGSSETR